MTTSLETGPADSLLSDFALAWKTGSHLAKDLDRVMDRQEDFQETSFSRSKFNVYCRPGCDGKKPLAKPIFLRGKRQQGKEG